MVASFQTWLFRSGPLWPLAMCRVLWATAMLLATWHEAGLAALYSDAQYHVPLLAFATPLTVPAFERLIALAAIGGALTLVGLFTRIGIALVSASLGYLFALDVLLFRNHVYLGLLIGALLLFAPCSERWSVSAVLRRLLGKPLRTTGSVACAQLIKAQVLIVYGYSAINKMRQPFLDGFVLERELPIALRSSPLRTLLRDAHGTYHPTIESFLHSTPALATCAAIVFLAEAFLVVGLPSRQLRPYAVAIGLALHTTIYLTMGIHVFGLLMISSYVLFFDFSGHPDPSPRRSPG
jgi:hypothetical protein